MYDSPLDYCSVCKIYVALDEGQHQCALWHRCGRVAASCPLAKFHADGELSPATHDAAQSKRPPDGLEGRRSAGGTPCHC
jgi:hypothetical protein